MNLSQLLSKIQFLSDAREVEEIFADAKEAVHQGEAKWTDVLCAVIDNNCDTLARLILEELRDQDIIKEFINQQNFMLRAVSVKAYDMLELLSAFGSNVVVDDHAVLREALTHNNDETNVASMVLKLYPNPMPDAEMLLNLIVQHNNIEAVKDVLYSGVDINQPYKGQTAVVYALQNSYHDMAKFLLQNGAQVQIIQENSEILKSYFTYNQYEKNPKRDEVVKLIVLANFSHPQELVDIVLSVRNADIFYFMLRSGVNMLGIQSPNALMTTAQNCYNNIANKVKNNSVPNQSQEMFSRSDLYTDVMFNQLYNNLHDLDKCKKLVQNSYKLRDILFAHCDDKEYAMSLFDGNIGAFFQRMAINSVEENRLNLDRIREIMADDKVPDFMKDIIVFNSIPWYLGDDVKFVQHLLENVSERYSDIMVVDADNAIERESKFAQLAHLCNKNQELLYSSYMTGLVSSMLLEGKWREFNELCGLLYGDTKEVMQEFLHHEYYYFHTYLVGLLDYSGCKKEAKVANGIVDWSNLEDFWNGIMPQSSSINSAEIFEMCKEKFKEVDNQHNILQIVNITQQVEKNAYVAEKFLNACRNNEIGVLNELSIDVKHLTPKILSIGLEHAVRSSNVNTVEWFVKNNLCVAALDAEQKNIIHLALNNDSSIHTVATLIAANYHLINTPDTDGCTLLMHAVNKGRYDVVQFLLKKGANVNLVDNKMESALTKSLKLADASICKLLKQCCVDGNDIRSYQTVLANDGVSMRCGNVTKFEKWKDSSIEFSQLDQKIKNAWIQKELDIFKSKIIIGSYYDSINVRNSVVCNINKGNQDAALRVIENARNADWGIATALEDCTPLMLAAEKGMHKVVQALLNTTIDVNKCTTHKTTALSYAVKSGNRNIVKDIEKHLHKDLITLVDDQGYTPLMRAVETKDVKMVTYLRVLSDKHNDAQCMSALSTALLTKDAGMIKYYLNAALPTWHVVDKNGYIPLMYAIQTKNFNTIKSSVEAMGRSISDIHSKDLCMSVTSKALQTQDHDIIQYILDKVGVLHEFDKNGCTPMVYAVRTGNLEVVKQLIDYQIGSHYYIAQFAEIAEAAKLEDVSILSELLSYVNSYDYNAIVRIFEESLYNDGCKKVVEILIASGKIDIGKYESNKIIQLVRGYQNSQSPDYKDITLYKAAMMNKLFNMMQCGEDVSGMVDVNPFLEEVFQGEMLFKDIYSVISDVKFERVQPLDVFGDFDESVIVSAVVEAVAFDDMDQYGDIDEQILVTSEISAKFAEAGVMQRGRMQFSEFARKCAYGKVSDVMNCWEQTRGNGIFGLGLHSAARAKNSDVLQYLLDSRPGVVDTVDKKTGFSALFEAIDAGDRECTRILLNHNASVVLRDLKGNNVLMHALMGKNEEIIVMVLNKVLALENVVQYLQNKNDILDTLLHVAADHNHVKLLMDELSKKHFNVSSLGVGAEEFITKRNKSGNSAFEIAVRKNNIKDAKSLQKLANNSVNGNVLFNLINHNNVAMVKFLLEQKVIDVNYSDRSGKTLLMQATKQENSLMMKLLVEYGANIAPAFQNAVNSRNIDAMKLFIVCGGNVKDIECTPDSFVKKVKQFQNGERVDMSPSDKQIAWLNMLLRTEKSKVKALVSDNKFLKSVLNDQYNNGRLDVIDDLSLRAIYKKCLSKKLSSEDISEILDLVGVSSEEFNDLCMHGNLEEIKNCLHKERDSAKESLVKFGYAYAIIGDQADVVRYFLDNHFKINAGCYPMIVENVNIFSVVIDKSSNVCRDLYKYIINNTNSLNARVLNVLVDNMENFVQDDAADVYYNLFAEAIKKNNINIIRKLLKAIGDRDTNYSPDGKDSLLLLALKNNPNSEIAKLLLVYGATVKKEVLDAISQDSFIHQVAKYKNITSPQKDDSEAYKIAVFNKLYCNKLPAEFFQSEFMKRMIKSNLTNNEKNGGNAIRAGAYILGNKLAELGKPDELNLQYFIDICKESTLDRVKWLMKFIPESDQRAYYAEGAIAAVKNGNVDILRHLLENNVDMSYANAQGGIFMCAMERLDRGLANSFDILKMLWQYCTNADLMTQSLQILISKMIDKGSNADVNVTIVKSLQSNAKDGGLGTGASTVTYNPVMKKFNGKADVNVMVAECLIAAGANVDKVRSKLSDKAEVILSTIFGSDDVRYYKPEVYQLFVVNKLICISDTGNERDLLSLIKGSAFASQLLRCVMTNDMSGINMKPHIMDMLQCKVGVLSAMLDKYTSVVQYIKDTTRSVDDSLEVSVENIEYDEHFVVLQKFTQDCRAGDVESVAKVWSSLSDHGVRAKYSHAFFDAVDANMTDVVRYLLENGVVLSQERGKMNAVFEQSFKVAYTRNYVEILSDLLNYFNDKTESSSPRMHYDVINTGLHINVNDENDLSLSGDIDEL